MNTQFGKYNDAELFLCLKKSKKEAEGAFAELYSRYSQRVYAYALRVTGSPEDSRDIFQETFLKLYDSVKRVDAVDNIPAYLMKIARNLCLNLKRNRKLSYSIEDFELTVNDTGYEQKEMLDILARALDCLDFEFREAFVLRQYHGLAYSEIAEITGDPISTVRNRVWRAKEKIKHILSPYLEDLSK